MRGKIMRRLAGVILAATVFAGGCGGKSDVQGAIEKTDYDTSVEDVSVGLSEGERYTNPISDENMPYRFDSVEAQVLTGTAPEDAARDVSKCGDPYILRYNGKFYLYVSTDPWYCTYKVWESLDLIHYLYLGEYNLLDANGKKPEKDTAANDGLSLECPWAPEVHYWNGEFYMYTSPHASGHVVLKSTTGLPYGDYQMVNDSLSRHLDGSVFIDDNEDKWFVKVNDQDKGDGSWIVVQNMTDMTALKDRDDEYEISKVGFTGDHVEGPFMIKRDGIYYLVATGETVGAPGYRLNYAYNTSGLGKTLKIGDVSSRDAWQLAMEANAVIRTEGDYFGYGHGALTVGPDLDSWWFPYHMSRASGGGRTLGISRVLFAGGRLCVTGQDKAAAAPEAPDFYTSYFTPISDTDDEGKKNGAAAREAGWRSYTDERTLAGEGLYEADGKLLSGRLGKDGKSVELIKTSSRFTAEYSFKDVPTDGSFRCLFGGGYVTLEGGKNLALYVGGVKTAESPMLVHGEDWDWTSYHQITVAYADGRITVSMDGCRKIDTEAKDLGGEAAGFSGAKKGQIGGLVFSSEALGSSDRAVAKMVDGRFFAANFKESGEGEKASVLSDKSSVTRVTAKGDEDTYFNGTYHTYHVYKDACALKLAEGDRAVYVIDVSEDGLYSLESLFSDSSDGSVIKIQIDGGTPVCYTLRKSDLSVNEYDKQWYESLKWGKRLIDEFKLDKGLHTLTIKAVKGDYSAIEYEMRLTDGNAPKYSDTLKEKSGHTYYSNWMIKDGAYYAAQGQDNLVRFGGYGFTDYRATVEIRTDAMTSRSNKAGIVMRLTNPSVLVRQPYGSGMGYFVCVDSYGVSIERFDYNERLVAYKEISMSPDKWYELSAECIDNRVTAYLDGEKILEYADPYGFSRGAVGLFSHGAAASFRNLKVEPAGP